MLFMDKIISFDYFLTNFFNKIIPHNFFFDYLFSFFSLKGAFIIIWVIIILLIFFFEEKKNPGISKRDVKFAALLSISFLLTFLFTDILLKNFFQRPRPFFTDFNKFNCPLDFSFPSAHAATAFTAATILTFFDKKRHWFYYLIAILISYSRIYLGCHYFFDVVVGAMIGYIISRLLLFVRASSDR
jgi:undecaprenyl-diphosphatase